MIAKRLLVVSHTPHYKKGDQITGWGPTVRELDHLSSLFERVVHLAPLHKEEASASAFAYEASNITVRPIPLAGGKRWFHKISLLFRLPLYSKVLLEELAQCDAVHVRCPANISLLTLFWLAFVKFPKVRWVKYAGNWDPKEKRAFSQTLQREWLNRNFHRGVVTVNGQWPDQPPHVISFLNPCLTEQELNEGKQASLLKNLEKPCQLLFCGVLDDYKGAGRLIEIAEDLNKKSIDFEFHIAGDGPKRLEMEAQVEKAGLKKRVFFEGWIPKAGLSQFYAKAHFMIFPSPSEGWPKALSEAMAWGAVPLASAVSCIPDYLKKFRTGRVFRASDTQAFADALQEYLKYPERWKKESKNGTDAAINFSYSHYLARVKDMMGMLKQ